MVLWKYDAKRYANNIICVMLFRYFQNIHTGESTGCDCELYTHVHSIPYTHSHSPVPDPQVGFVVMSVSVSEGMALVELGVTASGPGHVRLTLEEGTATGQTSEGEISDECPQHYTISPPTSGGCGSGHMMCCVLQLGQTSGGCGYGHMMCCVLQLGQTTVPWIK